MRVVLDTHAAIWWSFFPDQLSEAARRAIDEAEIIGLPAIVFWEAALLVRRGKLELPMHVSEWCRRMLEIPRCRQVPLDASMAISADALPMHPDPADRFIVAAAMDMQATLVTRDALIRQVNLVDTVW